MLLRRCAAFGLTFSIAATLLNCGQDTSKPAGQGTASMHDAPMSAHGNTGGISGGAVKYTAPAEWTKEEPQSSMRMDQYRLPGANGKEDAELAVFFFPGTGGSVEDNLNRWYGQFHVPNGGPVTKPEHKETLTANGIPVTIVYVTGIYMKPKAPMMMDGPKDPVPGYAMLAAIAETAQGPWFFKATGPEETIGHWRESFNGFVKTFKME